MSDYLNTKMALKLAQAVGLKDLPLPIDTIESMCDDLEAFEQENAKLKNEIESHKQSLALDDKTIEALNKEANMRHDELETRWQELDECHEANEQLLKELGIKRKVNMEQQGLIQKCQTEIETQAQTIAILSATVEKLEEQNKLTRVGDLTYCKIEMSELKNKELRGALSALENENRGLRAQNNINESIILGFKNKRGWHTSAYTEDK